MYENTPEEDRALHAFFIDYMLQGADGEPQILAATKSDYPGREDVYLIPVRTDGFLHFWKEKSKGARSDDTLEQACGDIWRREYAYDMSGTIRPGE